MPYSLLSVIIFTLLSPYTTVTNNPTTPQPTAFTPVEVSATAACGIEILSRRTAVNYFINDYLDAKNHRAFAQAAGGAWAARSARSSPEHAAQAALIGCRKNNEGYESLSPCQVIHIDDHWMPACTDFVNH